MATIYDKVFEKDITYTTISCENFRNLISEVERATKKRCTYLGIDYIEPVIEFSADRNYDGIDITMQAVIYRPEAQEDIARKARLKKRHKEHLLEELAKLEEE
jgi:hypothetical protein